MSDHETIGGLGFDHGAALAAVEEARTTLAALLLIGEQEQPAIDASRAQWSGEARRRADPRLDLHMWSLRHAVELLCRLIADIESAIDEARDVEQAER